MDVWFDVEGFIYHGNYKVITNLTFFGKLNYGSWRVIMSSTINNID